jgi:hypothetical protein
MLAVLNLQISSVTELKKKYGNTYPARYRPTSEFDPENPFWYFIGSKLFHERFSHVQEGSIQPCLLGLRGSARRTTEAADVHLLMTMAHILNKAGIV